MNEINTAKKLLQTLKSTHSRQLLVISGHKQWCIEYLVAFLHQADINRAQCQANLAIADCHFIPKVQIEQQLGQECAHFIFDAHDDFNANHLGIIGGTVKAGGIVFLLVPELTKWQEGHDYYRRFFCTVLLHDSRCLIVSQHSQHQTQQTILQQIEKIQRLEQIDWPNYNQQALAIKAVLHVVEGQRRRPLVLYADRGRGKSASLGFATNQLVAKGCQQIIITANSKNAANAVFKHVHPEYITHQYARFRSIEELISDKVECDIVLVDEAATIPLAQLMQLLKLYPRIAFASTVHGYEGTGRGFNIHFNQLLQKHSRGVKTLALSSPIRWRSDDPLEQILSRLLMLDAETGTDIDKRGDKQTLNPTSITFEKLDAKRLYQDEKQLRQLFGLLTLAHYRTQPRDLQHLLNSQNWHIFCAKESHSDTLIAALICIDEQIVDNKLRPDIIAGKRRPKGHLLAQTLAIHNAIDDALDLHFQRINRIVVQPEQQRNKIGSKLLHFAVSQFKPHHIIGTSFSMQPHLLEFWHKNNFAPVRIGSKARVASSIQHALYLYRGNDAARTLIKKSQQRLLTQLPLLCCNVLRQTPANLIRAVLSQLCQPPSLLPEQIQHLHQFSFCQRSPESVINELTLVIGQLPQAYPIISHIQTELMIEQIWQQQLWQESNTRSKKPTDDIRLITAEYLRWLASDLH